MQQVEQLEGISDKRMNITEMYRNRSGKQRNRRKYKQLKAKGANKQMIGGQKKKEIIRAKKRERY